MIIIKGLKLPKITGIALWPFILIKPKSVSNIIINHEKIHIRQQAELLVIPFYLWYLTEWFFKYIYFRSFEKAYYNISFEREAYQNESNLKYLESRKFWEFLKYYKS